jgi:hypothetical protein
VWLARRNGPDDAFFSMGQVQGLPESGWYDPALADVFGEMHLLFASTYSQEIMLARLDLSDRSIGSPRAIVRTSRPSGIPNSPCPIVSSSGELLGVSHFDKVGLDNDHYLALDFDPETPSLRFVDTPAWHGNGGFASGTFFSIEQTALLTNRVVSYDAPWWAGGQGYAGETLDLVFYGPPQVEPRFSAVLGLGGSFLPSPIAISGFGSLGIEPLGSIWLDVGMIDGPSGQARLPLPIPDDNELRNVLVPAQSVAFDLFTNQVILGNTAGLRIL